MSQLSDEQLAITYIETVLQSEQLQKMCRRVPVYKTYCRSAASLQCVDLALHIVNHM